jgi:hypothetical protein
LSVDLLFCRLEVKENKLTIRGEKHTSDVATDAALYQGYGLARQMDAIVGVNPRKRTG